MSISPPVDTPVDPSLDPSVAPALDRTEDTDVLAADAADPPAYAAHVLSSLATVFRLMRKTAPAPMSPQDEAAWADAKPAPRHIAALLLIALEAPIGVSALADRLSVSLATASQVVSDLEDGGIVTRVNDPSDRRRTLVNVAPGRESLIRTMLDNRLRPMQRALERMTPTARREFVRGLDLLAEELGFTAS